MNKHLIRSSRIMVILFHKNFICVDKNKSEII